MTARKKVTNYFSHDSNARNDEKIVRLRMKHGAEGYGVYFMLLERLREETDYKSVKDYDMLAFDFRVEAEVIKSVVEDFGLFAFTADGEYFYSNSFERRMESLNAVRATRSVAGRKGVEKRWSKTIANVSNSDSKTIANVSNSDSKTIANVSNSDSKTIANVSNSDSKTIANVSNSIATKQTKQTNKQNKVVDGDDSARPREERGMSEGQAEKPAANERLWAAAFLADAWGVQNACAALAVNGAKLSELTADFLCEQAAKGVRHTDEADFRRHLFDWARLHLNHEARDQARLEKQQSHANDRQKLVSDANRRDLEGL